MSYLESVPVVATEDLNSDQQYHAVAIGGTIAASNVAVGILQNKPKSGEDAAAGYLGWSRFRAGAAVSAGASVMVTTSGWFITVTSGYIGQGKAMGAVSSGGIGEGIFNFANNITIA